MKYIGMDLGASLTRVKNLDNSEYTYKLANNIQVIGLDADTSNLDVGNELQNMLDLTITKGNIDDVEGIDLRGIWQDVPLRVLVGDLATRYGQGKVSNELPDALANKMQQRVNWVNLLTGVVYTHLSIHVYNKGESVEISDISLVLALPHGEVQHNRDILTECIKGEYSVRLNLLGVDIKFNIVDVNLVFESSMAVLSYLFSLKSRKFDGTLLSIDIGASTSDLLVVENSRVNDSTTGTLKSGCNLVRETVASKLSGSGMVLKGERLDNAIYEGRYKLGTTYKDCSGIIQEAKKEASNSLASEVLKYLTKHQLDIRHFDGILITGGGSLKGGYMDNNKTFVETSDSLSNYLLDSLRQRFKDLPELLEYKWNVRDANITGIYYKLKMLELNNENK